MAKALSSALSAVLLLVPVLPCAPAAGAPRDPIGQSASPPTPTPAGSAPQQRPAGLPMPQPVQAQGGRSLRLNGMEQRAAWRLEAPPGGGEGPIWLPLEVLQGQLGVSSRSRPDGSLDLEWYGATLLVPVDRQRSLDDEVAVDAAPLLRERGVAVAVSGERLDLTLPPPRLLGLRSSRSTGGRRIVLDLEAPALLRSEAGALALSLWSAPEQRQQLRSLGLTGLQREGLLALTLPAGGSGARWFTLGSPARVVIDLPAAAGAGEAAAGAGQGQGTPALDPRLQALLGRTLVWERRVITLGAERFLLNAISLDPRSAPLELLPLRSDMGMEGLSLLPTLARRRDALVAINGGYFNRVRRLPLGALRERGRWLSGPILNRGAIGWEPGQLPRFGRLQLQEWLLDAAGGRWPLMALNSGYVQRGLSRYTADWGAWYRALSDGENGVLLRDGLVARRLDPRQLAAGVPLAPADVLVVGRGGSVPPWGEGERLQLDSRPSDPLGMAPYVLGGGPLLLQEGRVVLQGAGEGFSGAFLSQGAPRTVIGGDGTRLWLLTLQGIGQDGPTLGETALLLQGLGIRDALNLDGGSSTGLVIGGAHTVKGRGVAAAIHNGLGLVLRPGTVPPADDAALSPGEPLRPLTSDGS